MAAQRSAGERQAQSRGYSGRRAERMERLWLTTAERAPEGELNAQKRAADPEMEEGDKAEGEIGLK